jgi:hypothetical protein
MGLDTERRPIATVFTGAQSEAGGKKLCRTGD